MNEIPQIVATVKRLLRAQGKTYRDIAGALHLSEASVKRLFASGRFSAGRLVDIANILGYTLAELAQEAAASSSRISTLTEAQENELVKNSKLLLVAACVLNHWSLTDIVVAYRLTEAEGVQCLARLDRLRLIDLLPGNRIRLNISREFEWRINGPIRKHFRAHWQHDFLNHDFRGDDEAETFFHGMLTDQAIAQLQKEVRKLRLRFSELHTESLSAPLKKRRGTGLILAMREWEPQQFAKLRR